MCISKENVLKWLPECCTSFFLVVTHVIHVSYMMQAIEYRDTFHHLIVQCKRCVVSIPRSRV